MNEMSFFKLDWVLAVTVYVTTATNPLKLTLKLPSKSIVTQTITQNTAVLNIKNLCDMTTKPPEVGPLTTFKIYFPI